jgi:hypothetical protein
MKFEIDLNDETIKKLTMLKDNMDRDMYYALDYDEHTHKSATWDDVFKDLLNRYEHFWDLINDKDKKLKVVIRDDQ